MLLDFPYKYNLSACFSKPQSRHIIFVIAFASYQIFLKLVLC